MKRSISRLNLRSPLALVLVSLALAATLITFAVSASRNAKRADAPQAISAVSKSNRKPLTRIANRKTLAPVVPFAGPVVTATLADDITLAAKKNPGDTITYTLNIANTGTSDATGINFSDVVDAHTTLLAGSGVLATDDDYNTVGNVQINVPVAQGLLANDKDITAGNNTGMTAGPATSSSAQCPACNNVTISSNGSFTYDPPINFSGTDTFTYTATTSGGKTATATARITVSGKLWFINDNAGACPGAPCDGRLSHPFQTLAAFQAVNNGAVGHPAAGDVIFIYESATSYTGPATLLNNQKFIGQDATASLITISALTQPSGTDPLPVMNTGAPAVTITSASNGINLGSGNTLRGFTVGATTGTKISGTSFGILLVGDSTLPDVILSGNGQALNLTTGTFAATSKFVSVATTSSTTSGLTLTSIAGTVAFGSTTISGNNNECLITTSSTADINFGNTSCTANVVSLSGNTAGTRTFGTLSVTGGAGNAFSHSGGGGNVTVTGAANLSSVAPDTIVIQNAASGNQINFAGGATINHTGAGGNGIQWSGTNTNATLTFATLGLTTSNGTGMNLSGGGTVNVTTAAGSSISATGDATHNGAAIIANGIALGANLTSLSSTNNNFAGSNGVSLTNVTGTSGFGLGSISGSAGDAFFVSGQNGTFTYNGTITSGSAHSVNVTGKTGGTVNFGGAITDNDTGITLTSNTNATINFTGAISATTTTNTAFNATGGGTVTASNTASTIVTTTGKGVNINSTTIGAAGVKFLSINTNGAANGINLNTTGAGAFTVIGDGGGANNGSGGTIQNTTAEGIVTNSTGTLSFGYLNVTNSGTKGISVTGSTGVTINRCNVTDNAGGATDEGLNLINNTGTITLSDDVVDSAPHNQVNIQNTNTNITAIVATNSTFKCTAGNICQPSGSVGADAMLVQMSGTSILTSANVQSCTFSGVRSTGLQVSVDTTARIGSSSGGVITAPAASNSFVVQSCTVTNNNAGIDMSKSQSSNLTFQILNNLTITGQKSQPINSQSGAGAGFGGTITGNISGNVIGTQGIKDSGTTLGNGIRLVVQGDSTQGFYTVDNNTIREVPNGGNGIISLFSQDGVASVSGTGFARFKITNNTLPLPSGTNQSIGCGAGVPCLDSGIFLLADQHNAACALITGNSIFDVTAFPATGTADVYLAERTGPAAGATITVQTGSNGGNSAAALAFINANNTLAGASKSIDEEGNATTVSSCGSFPPVTPFDGGGLSRLNSPGLSSMLLASSTNSGCSQNNPGLIPTTNARVVEASLQQQQLDAIVSAAITAEPPANEPSMPVTIAGAGASAQSQPGSPISARLKQALHPVASFAAQMAFLGSGIDHWLTPSVSAAPSSAATESAPQQKGVTPQSGETLNASIGTLHAGDSAQITFQVTVDTPPLVKSVSTQGTVAGSNFSNVLTDDPETGAVNDATVTNINTTSTWVGLTSTDWNDKLNWSPNTYAPGVSNPAVNDVVIPSVGNQPTIGTTDISIFSLNISNGRTLSITSPRILTIGGAPGGNLTLDGIISGGFLNLGTGTHTISNAGGTGSLTGGNVMTVLSGSTTTLSDNLQAGSVTINAGGSLDITNRTLSLTGSLNNAGTFTHPIANGDGANPGTPPGDGLLVSSSTVVFDGSGAQTVTDTTPFNNLTINNTGGSVTLGSNATVNGTLTLTSDLTTTNAFTLSQPLSSTTSGGADVVGNLTRTNAGVQFPSATNITFGNPNTLLNFLNQGTRPTAINFRLTETAPTDAATGGTNTGFPGAVKRTWLITPTGGSGFSATMQLHYLVGDLNGNSEATPGPGPATPPSLRLYKYVILSPSTGWQQQDKASNFANTTIDTSVAGSHFVKLVGVTGFSPWTIGGVSPTAATSTVTGRITDDAGNPVEGAVIRLNGTQNRKTITDAFGNYSFSEVETNGFYTVTPSRVNYNFAPVTRGFSALGAHTEASFGAALNGNQLNPLDTTEYFVRQQYVDFLGREPEEKGFNDWTDTVNNCTTGHTSCDRIHVSESFFRSDEFQQRGYFVYRFYSTAFGQKPDYTAFAPDLGRVSGFLDATQLEAAKTQFAIDFTSRAAFVNQYGMLSNSAYVDALSQTAGVTLSNRQALVDSLSAGTMNRAQALRQIVESNEVYAKYYNQAFVVMEYFGYLRRDPDLLYLNWISVLDANPADSRHMVEGFVDATEYRNRFKQ